MNQGTSGRQLSPTAHGELRGARNLSNGIPVALATSMNLIVDFMIRSG